MKNNIWILAAGLALLAAFKPATNGYKPGDAVEAFSLKNIDGKQLGFKDYKDAKGFIVIFTCNHCPFSKAYEDRIIALDQKFKSQGYPVIAINSNDSVQYPEDSYENMKLRASEKGFTFPYLYDETQAIAKQWGAEKTPHVYIVEKHKKVYTLKYVGAIDNNSKDAAAADKKYVEDALLELLAGKPVTTSSTKAVGCGIKWKS